MAILEIARMGHPLLRAMALDVDEPTASDIKALVADMCDTLADIGGARLAAPQVLVPKRVVIFHVPADRITEEPGAETVGLTCLVNPVLEPLSDEMEPGWEGCLSVPGLRGVVPRYIHVRYRGITPQGEEINREAHGFHARVIQHECDHLDGILFPQRMTDLSLLGFADELKHGLAETVEARRDSAGNIP